MEIEFRQLSNVDFHLFCLINNFALGKTNGNAFLKTVICERVPPEYHYPVKNQFIIVHSTFEKTMNFHEKKSSFLRVLPEKCQGNSKVEKSTKK